MRKIHLILLTFLLIGTSSINSSAQVKKLENQNFVFKIAATSHNTGETYYYELPGVEVIKVNSIGKILRIITFKLDDNTVMELANPVVNFVIRSVTGDFDGDGEDEEVDGKYAVISSSGNLKLVYHSL